MELVGIYKMKKNQPASANWWGDKNTVMLR